MCPAYFSLKETLHKAASSLVQSQHFSLQDFSTLPVFIFPLGSPSCSFQIRINKLLPYMFTFNSNSLNALVLRAYKLTLTKKLCFHYNHSSTKNTPSMHGNWLTQNIGMQGKTEGFHRSISTLTRSSVLDQPRCTLKEFKLRHFSAGYISKCKYQLRRLLYSQSVQERAGCRVMASLLALQLVSLQDQH